MVYDTYRVIYDAVVPTTEPADRRSNDGTSNTRARSQSQTFTIRGLIPKQDGWVTTAYAIYSPCLQEIASKDPIT